MACFYATGGGTLSAEIQKLQRLFKQGVCLVWECVGIPHGRTCHGWCDGNTYFCRCGCPNWFWTYSGCKVAWKRAVKLEAPGLICMLQGPLSPDKAAWHDRRSSERSSAPPASFGDADLGMVYNCFVKPRVSAAKRAQASKISCNQLFSVYAALICIILCPCAIIAASSSRSVLLPVTISTRLLHGDRIRRSAAAEVLHEHIPGHSDHRCCRGHRTVCFAW